VHSIGPALANRHCRRSLGVRTLWEGDVNDIKYVASFRYTHQVGPDDFDSELHTMICTPNTTLAEILDWRKRRTHFDDTELYVQISQAT
jgi:hypothetical protein